MQGSRARIVGNDIIPNERVQTCADIVRQDRIVSCSILLEDERKAGVKQEIAEHRTVAVFRYMLPPQTRHILYNPAQNEIEQHVLQVVRPLIERIHYGYPKFILSELVDVLR